MQRHWRAQQPRRRSIAVASAWGGNSAAVAAVDVLADVAAYLATDIAVVQDEVWPNNVLCQIIKVAVPRSLERFGQNCRFVVYFSLWKQ